jgi:hypothetical protein
MGGVLMQAAVGADDASMVMQMTSERGRPARIGLYATQLSNIVFVEKCGRGARAPT